MKFGFVTCVELGLRCMEEIYAAGGRLDVVITLKDELARKKSGRTYVDDICQANGIDVLKIRNINDEEAVRAVRAGGIDWLFIIGWSQIAREELLAAPRKGVLGMHPTLLPVGRGRAAIPWAILKRLPETGVTLFRLASGVDTGPILAQERIPLAPNETATNLYARVVAAHQRLMRRAWPDLVNDRLRPIPQDEALATEWPGRTPEDGRLNRAMTLEEVDRLVRATTRPYPGAFWDDHDKRIRIWRGKFADPATASSPNALRLEFQDGFYDALDFEIEPLCANEA